MPGRKHRLGMDGNHEDAGVDEDISCGHGHTVRDFYVISISNISKFSMMYSVQYIHRWGIKAQGRGEWARAGRHKRKAAGQAAL